MKNKGPKDQNLIAKISPFVSKLFGEKNKKCVFYAAKTEIQYCETRTNMFKGFQTFAINIHKINN